MEKWARHTERASSNTSHWAASEVKRSLARSLRCSSLNFIKGFIRPYYEKSVKIGARSTYQNHYIPEDARGSKEKYTQVR